MSEVVLAVECLEGTWNGGDGYMTNCRITEVKATKDDPNPLWRITIYRPLEFNPKTGRSEVIPGKHRVVCNYQGSGPDELFNFQLQLERVERLIRDELSGKKIPEVTT